MSIDLFIGLVDHGVFDRHRLSAIEIKYHAFTANGLDRGDRRE